MKITTTLTVMSLWKGILHCTGDKQATNANSAPVKPSDGSKSVPINPKLQPLAVPTFDGNKARRMIRSFALETYQSMPIRIEIDSVSSEFLKK